MNYEELHQKCSALLRENQKLQKEIRALKEQFGIIELPVEFNPQAEQPSTEQVSFLDNT